MHCIHAYLHSCWATLLWGTIAYSNFFSVLILLSECCLFNLLVSSSIRPSRAKYLHIARNMLFALVWIFSVSFHDLFIAEMLRSVNIKFLKFWGHQIKHELLERFPEVLNRMEMVGLNSTDVCPYYLSFPSLFFLCCCCCCCWFLYQSSRRSRFTLAIWLISRYSWIGSWWCQALIYRAEFWTITPMKKSSRRKNFT
jgi:hypothetical protein